jgi:uncharacterized protein YhaN
MKFNELEVAGFGVWRELRLTNLSPGLNVFYGANESGKTTLMQFVRGVLYGYSSSRRQRYFPPLHGGEPGGSIRVQDDRAPRRVERLDVDAETYPLGRLRIVDDEGAVSDDGALREYLGPIDETTYVNIFAVGLHELEELRSLSDTDAADMLYKLSTGLDRVSLLDVVRELTVSRNRLLAPDGRTSQITQLLGRRDQIQAEIEELRAAAERYAQLSADQHDFDESVRRLQEEVREHEHDSRVLEAAVGLRDPWERRRRLALQLADLGELPAIRPQTLEELDHLNARIARRRARALKARERGRRARRLAAAIRVNETLDRQAPRIVAAAEQVPWISELDKQIQSLRDEITQLEKRHAERPKPVPQAAPAPPPAPAPVTQLGPRFKGTVAQALAQLKPLGKQLRDAKLALKAAHADHKAAEEAAKAIVVLRVAAPAPTKPAPAAIEAAGELVNRLRKRQQLDEKLEKLELQENEIADEGRAHLEHRVLSAPAMFGLAVPAVGGATTSLASVLFQESLFGGNWLMWTLVGGCSGIGAVVYKSVKERAAAVRYEEAREQLEAVEAQANKLRAERDRLDAELPAGGGPIAVRLRTAQQELAALQGAVSVVDEQRSIQQDAKVSRAELDEAIARFNRARKNWREKLNQLGLPPNTQLRTLRDLAEQTPPPPPAPAPVPVVEIPSVQPQLEAKRAELAHRRRELESVEDRLRMLVADCLVEPPQPRPAQQILSLRAELSRQDEVRTRRLKLLARRRRYAQRFAKERRRLRRLLRARKRLLRHAGVFREDELRRVVATHSTSLELRTQAEAVEREVLGAIGGIATLAEVGELLDASPAIDLEARWEASTAKLEAAQRQLQDLYERRGRRGEQISALLADRRLPARIFDLGLVDEQLRQAIERWQTLSLAGQTLEHVRRVFERDHQPIVLREASEHLARLTKDRYTRIWAPLDRPVLLIDNAAGETIDVDKLSRGTREQIFLGLRLALVAAYARRGVRLPMVLDDVLVNFDQDRATSAAAVLRDFAAAGHQILFFTCHEHIFKLFKALKVACQELPGHIAAVAELPAEIAPPPPPKRTPRPRAPRKTAPAVVLPPPPEPKPEPKPEPRPFPKLPIVELPPPVEPEPVHLFEPIYPTPLEIAGMLEVIESVVEPAPALEELTETVMPIVDVIPPAIEITLPPTMPTLPPPRPRRRRETIIEDANRRFTWEDPVDLPPSKTYFLDLDDDGDEA